jgi:hypothetical protein
VRGAGGKLPMISDALFSAGLGRDPYAMYDDLCRITGQRHDPCLLDTFIAAVRFWRASQ